MVATPLLLRDLVTSISLLAYNVAPLPLQDRDLKLQKFQQEDSRYFALCWGLVKLLALQLPFRWTWPVWICQLHPGLSMQVGGTGLTVTGANRVILVDPAWNPSADAQAIDRVHRIGQKQEAGWPMGPWLIEGCVVTIVDSLEWRQVVVYRLIGSGAIEDKMFRLQIFKGGLSKTFMEHEQQVRFFTHKQLGSSDQWVQGHVFFKTKLDQLDCLLHLQSVRPCHVKSSPAWGWSHCSSSPTSTPGVCLEIQSRKPIRCWH